MKNLVFAICECSFFVPPNVFHRTISTLYCTFCFVCFWCWWFTCPYSFFSFHFFILSQPEMSIPFCYSLFFCLLMLFFSLFSFVSFIIFYHLLLGLHFPRRSLVLCKNTFSSPPTISKLLKTHAPHDHLTHLPLH
ncbi:MAG: hypothetical protein J3R72DRAFT_158009 [Linnemannia gamsii]|nr:MAG: hypothetical protein J3R72DRAFT_158009 [Linnemannia gamsii]